MTIEDDWNIRSQFETSESVHSEYNWFNWTQVQVSFGAQNLTVIISVLHYWPTNQCSSFE